MSAADECLTGPLPGLGRPTHGYLQHYGVMAADLRWDEVRSLFDPDLMGALPDLGVPGTSTHDWQLLLDLVTSSGWRSEYAEGQVVTPLPRAETILSRPTGAECPSLRVWPTPRMLVIFRFSSPTEIDFDVDLREIRGQEALDEFCGFVKTIGQRLGKPVLMDAEGGDPCVHPVLGYDVKADRFFFRTDSVPSPVR